MSVDFKESGPHRFWIRRHGSGFGEQYHVVDRETGRVTRCTSMLDTALSDCCKRNGVQYTSAPTAALKRQGEPSGFTQEDVDVLRWVIAKKCASYPIAPGINAGAILRQADDVVNRLAALLSPREGER